MQTGAKGARFFCAAPQRAERGKRANGGVYAENEDPQPQVVVALGFLITNCAPSISSL